MSLRDHAAWLSVESCWLSRAGAERRLSDEGSRLLGGGAHKAATGEQLSVTSNQSRVTSIPAALHAAALHLAMRWLNLQPGDEVVCSTLTFSASVNPVLYERATPVFVDCDERS